MPHMLADRSGPKPFKIDTEPPSRSSPAPLSAPMVTPTSKLYLLGKSTTGLSDLDLLRSTLSTTSEGMHLALSPVRSNSLTALFGSESGRQSSDALASFLAGTDRQNSEVALASPPFLSGLSTNDLHLRGDGLGSESMPTSEWAAAEAVVAAAAAAAAAHAASSSSDSNVDARSQAGTIDSIETGELPPLPSEYSYAAVHHQQDQAGGAGADQPLPLLLQHVVSDPDTGAQTVELVLYDPATGNWAVVPPELAAGLKFVQGDEAAEDLNLEFPLDGSTNVRVEQGPMLPPMPTILPAPTPIVSAHVGARQGSTSPSRPHKKSHSRGGRGGSNTLPIPSMDITSSSSSSQLYPSQALYSDPSEETDTLGSTPNFDSFRSSFRNPRQSIDSLDSTPRSSRTNSLAVDDSGSSAPPSRSGSPLGKRAFTASSSSDDPELGSAMHEMELDGDRETKKPKKLYYCGYEGCERSFTTSGHLSRHKRIHIGTKSFLCPIPTCTSSFFRSDNMMTHYRVHARKLGIRPLDDAQAVSAGEYDADLSAAGLDGDAQKRAWEAAMDVSKMANNTEGLRVTKPGMEAWKGASTGSLIGDVAVLAGNVEATNTGSKSKKEKKMARA